MVHKNISAGLIVLVLWLATGFASTQAQDLGATVSAGPDTLPVLEKPAPRLRLGGTAGAFGGTLGFGSYLAPRIGYQVTPRLQVFTSLLAIQRWDNFNSSFKDDGFSSSFSPAPNRQLLLHVGGAYALTEKLTLTGSVWKDLRRNGAAMRQFTSPYGLSRYPRQGYHFQAQYQVSENVTLSGGVSSGNGFGQSQFGNSLGSYSAPWMY